MTSVNSFGQSGISLAEIQDLQKQLNQVENKLANPYVAASPEGLAELQSLQEHLTAKLLIHTKLLMVENPADYETLVAWTEHAEAEQVEDLNVSNANANSVKLTEAELLLQNRQQSRVQ